MLATSLIAIVALLSLSESCFALDSQTFTLRHVHRTHADTGRVRWGNVSRDVVAASLLGDTRDGSSAHTHSLQTRRTSVHRPASQAAFHAARAHSRRRKKEKSVLGRFALDREWGQSVGWEEEDVQGPALDKRETVVTLAKMTNNAYLTPDEAGWYDLGGNWTTVSLLSFGLHELMCG